MTPELSMKVHQVVEIQGFDVQPGAPVYHGSLLVGGVFKVDQGINAKLQDVLYVDFWIEQDLIPKKSEITLRFGLREVQS